MTPDGTALPCHSARNLPIITTPYGIFAIVYILMPILTFIVLPLINYISRHFEHNADFFAAKSGYALDLARSLRHLSHLNFVPMNADIYFVIWFYSHPPITDRIKMLEGT